MGIDQERLVMDVAAAQEVFATRQRMDKAVIGRAHALKVRALVKLGELLKDLPKATGAAGIGRLKSAVPDRHHSQGAVTDADLGVTKKLASVAQQLAARDGITRHCPSRGQ